MPLKLSVKLDIMRRQTGQQDPVTDEKRNLTSAPRVGLQNTQSFCMRKWYKKRIIHFYYCNHSIKSSRAHSRVNWLQEETDVSEIISVPIIRVLMLLDFIEYRHIRNLMMGTEMVPETSVYSCNQLTRLCAREDFIEFSRRKSFKLCITVITIIMIIIIFTRC
jgi:hypothetical protein